MGQSVDTTNALHGTAMAVSESVGEAFFANLVKHLSQTLQVDYAVVGALAPDGESVTSVAAIGDGEVIGPVSYELAGTPCERVLRKEARGYTDAVQTEFPNFDLLKTLKARSYVGSALTRASGEPIGLLAVLHRESIRDLAIAESTLQIFAARASAELERSIQEDSLHLYRDIFNSTSELVAFVDKDGVYRAVNSMYETVFGRPASAVVGKPVSVLHPPEMVANTIMPNLEGALRGETRKVKVHIHPAPDTTRYVETLYSPHRNAAGEVVGAIVTSRDVTDATLAQDRESRLEAELRRSKRVEALGQLTGGVAHEFNNILAVVKGFGDLLTENKTVRRDTQLSGHVHEIVNAAHRGQDVVRQLMQYARENSGDKTPTEVGALVHQIRTMLEPLLPATIVFKTSINGRIPKLVLDASQIHQVLVNLCVNARDAMPDGGVLEIAVNAESMIEGLCDSCAQPYKGAFIELTVTDQGEGIAKAEQERIFEPFFTTKPPGVGTGLGLAVVHGIVHEHGGHIRLTSKLGEGTRIGVLLPVEPSLLAEHDHKDDESGQEGGVNEPAGTHAAHVLVVDDEPGIRAFMQFALQAVGYEVTVTNNPPAAVEMVRSRETRFDCVICDETMPVMTGTDFISRLSEEGLDVPVILCSGIGELRLARQAELAGANLYLSKPFDATQLRETVRHCIAGAARVS